MTPRPDRTKSILGLGATDTVRSSHRHCVADGQVLRRFVVDVARLLADRNCQDVVIFDLRGLCDVTDYIVLASGTSDRQILSVGKEVQEMAQEQDLVRFGREADTSTTWLVLDFVDMVVHLFDPDARVHYDLEMLWGDAPCVIWERE
jgi:ribosome-associated protein